MLGQGSCKRIAIAAAIAAAFPGATLAASVARVDFAVGNVTAIAPDGRSRPLARGSEIEVGDTVATQQGRAQLRFTDGARMSLQPGTEFKVDEYRFSGRADGDENIVMSLLKGGMRTITGLIGRINRDKYKLRTEVATIGIRGTEYSVSYTNSINVFCADGSIAVINDAGTLVLNSGEGGFVSSLNTAPARGDERPLLPPQTGGGTGGEIAAPTNPLIDSSGRLTGTFIGNRSVAGLRAGTFGFGELAFVEAGSVYSLGMLGPSTKTDGKLVLNADGTLTEFEGSTVTLGAAIAISSGNDGIIAWGRWTGGTTGGDGGFSGIDLTGGALHYVVGVPAANLPTTGTAGYDMIGFSGSCLGANCTGLTVNGSSLVVDFGQAKVDLSMSLTINGDNAGSYTFDAGANRAALSGASIGSVSGTLTGATASGSLTASGFLSGAGGARAGMAWTGNVSGNSQTDLAGVTAYLKK